MTYASNRLFTVHCCSGLQILNNGKVNVPQKYPYARFLFPRHSASCRLLLADAGETTGAAKHTAASIARERRHALFPGL